MPLFMHSKISIIVFFSIRFEGTVDEMVEVQDALSAAVSSVESEDNNDR